MFLFLPSKKSLTPVLALFCLWALQKKYTPFLGPKSGGGGSCCFPCLIWTQKLSRQKRPFLWDISGGGEGGILCLSSANLGNNGFDGGFYYSFYAERGGRGDKGLKMPLPPLLTCDARTHEHLAQKKEKIIIPPRFIFLFLACCVGDGRRGGTPLLIRRLKCHDGISHHDQGDETQRSKQKQHHNKIE